MERQQLIPPRDWQQLFLVLSTGTSHCCVWGWDPSAPLHLDLSANTVQVPWANITDPQGQPGASGERTRPCWVGTQPQQHSGSSGTGQAQQGWGDTVQCDRALLQGHHTFPQCRESPGGSAWPHQPEPTSAGSFRQAALIKRGCWELGPF